MARKYDEQPEVVDTESTQPEEVEDTTEAPTGDSEPLEVVVDLNPTDDTEAPENGADGDSGGDPEDTTEDDAGDADTFPRAYVEKLRKEAADARVKAQKVDELAGALWAARVAATGRLADPTDLPMPEDVDPLDPEAVTAAVEELLARKPHLASRVPRGDVGAGVVSESAPFSLGALIRGAV